MATESPFGKTTRLRVLEEYFAGAGEVTAQNAWEHIYKCLLWMNRPAGLAHIYDSNHMQPGGNFHARAVRFTDALCERWKISRKELPSRIDHLFKGCVTAWRKGGEPEVDPEIENELRDDITAILKEAGLPPEKIAETAKRIEAESRDFFTIEQKRKNALGEGFEDLLHILLQRVSRIRAERVVLRQPVSRLPGFRKAPPPQAGKRREREPHPDIAILEGEVTHIVATAKWSTRQDRETQFQAEYNAYQGAKIQSAQLRFVLITNEFDIARLTNVAQAIPTGAGGYVFHQIYHINPDLLRATHGDRIGAVGHHLGTGKIGSLADFLTEMQQRYGVS